MKTSLYVWKANGGFEYWFNSDGQTFRYFAYTLDKVLSYHEQYKDEFKLVKVGF